MSINLPEQAVVADIHKEAFRDERHVAAHRVMLLLYGAAELLRGKGRDREAKAAAKLAEATRGLGR